MALYGTISLIHDNVLLKQYKHTKKITQMTFSTTSNLLVKILQTVQTRKIISIV